ncbi:Microtubule-associated air9-like protein, partial [Thalictrum thalictroides]
LPVVSNVHVEELSSGIYIGVGEYYGGYEGSSLFSWYRETNEGNIVLINEANSTKYEVGDSDYNSRLLFGYTPVRSDSVVGELRLSEHTDVILPELPKVEMLALTGKAIEGEKISAVEVIPESDIQQRVWQKYKKEVKYQWFASTENGENDYFEPLTSQYSCSYKVRYEDIGRCLRCECIVTDVFGRCSGPVLAQTNPVLPGIPRFDKLEIEGRGFHTNLYAIRGIYSGGKEGKSRVQWLRSMVGSPDLISIPGEIGRMYEANVDDVGYRLVALYTPLREDGVEGQPVSASTEPITVEPEILKEVKQKVELGSVKFEVLCDKDRSPRKVLGVGSLERRILEVNRKRVKVVKPGSKTSFPATEIRGSYTPPFHVEVFRNDQHRLRIVVDSENEVDLMVQTRHMRDVIVLVIRSFAQRFNSTSLNSLLKIET